MEIVPILSTIILVGTVATFILAVAAYILYKMREGGASGEGDLSQQVEPHHVVMAVDNADMMMHSGDSGPAEASTYFAPTGTQPPQGSFIEKNNLYNRPPNAPHGGFQSLSESGNESIPLNSFFWEYTEDGFSPIDMQTGESVSHQNGSSQERNREE